MNMATATIGMDSGFFSESSSTGGVLFIAVFSIVGVILFTRAVRLVRRSCEPHHEPHAVRYTVHRH